MKYIKCQGVRYSSSYQPHQLASISTDLHEVVDKLFSKTLWHPTSRMRLIQFLFHTYGVREVAKAIGQRGSK